MTYIVQAHGIKGSTYLSCPSIPVAEAVFNELVGRAQLNLLTSVRVVATRVEEGESQEVEFFKWFQHRVPKLGKGAPEQ